MVYSRYTTSSAAQGGGGSFKNGKPIGEPLGSAKHPLHQCKHHARTKYNASESAVLSRDRTDADAASSPSARSSQVRQRDRPKDPLP